MNYKRFIISLILPQLAWVIGSFFTISAIPVWYAVLNKPDFNPPNNLFAPMWLTLYLLMGVSAYLIWQKSDTDASAKEALLIFYLHLIFNALWSVIFFGLRQIGVALVDITIVWLFVLLLIMIFYRINRFAAFLLLPYLLWVSFAGILNYYIWILN